jgi:hypothetical protein
MNLSQELRIAEAHRIAMEQSLGRISSALSIFLKREIFVLSQAGGKCIMSTNDGRIIPITPEILDSLMMGSREDAIRFVNNAVNK